MSDLQESDLTTLKEFHQFVRDDNYDEENKDDWRIRLARRYYDQLYKEFALVELTHYEAGIIGLRWRTEDEVVTGKGQEYCGTINCSSIDNLGNYELPFGYEEHGQEKAELVKVCICKKCAKKLKYYLEKQRELGGEEKESGEPKKKKQKPSS